HLREQLAHHQTLAGPPPRGRPISGAPFAWPCPHDCRGRPADAPSALGSRARCLPGRPYAVVERRPSRSSCQPRHHPPGDCPPELDAQKKTLGASERDEAARQAFRERIQQRTADDFVTVDECGSNLNLTPLYARAPRPEPAYGSIPRNTPPNTTLIASLTLHGMGPALVLSGATD